MTGISVSEITRIERVLSCKFPPEVREVYAQSNGKKGPTDIDLLWPHTDSDDGIIKKNEVFGDAELFPLSPHGVIYIGSDGCGGILFFRTSDLTAGLWYPADGQNTMEDSSCVADLWMRVEELYRRDEEKLL